MLPTSSPPELSLRHLSLSCHTLQTRRAALPPLRDSNETSVGIATWYNLYLFRVWSNEWPIYMLLYDNFVVNYGFARICLVTLFKINHQNLERLLNNFKLNWTRHVQDIIQKKISASLSNKILFESKYNIVQEPNLYIDKFRNVSITFHVKLRGEVSCHVPRGIVPRDTDWAAS